MRWFLIIAALLWSIPVSFATTYYISPSGSDSNNGTGTGTPWRTFTKAFSVATCGDTLTLRNGTYGDGNSTGKIALPGRICTEVSPLTIRAENPRQARINDSGSGFAINLTNGTKYIVLDGLVANSTNNSAPAASGTCSTGMPFNGNTVSFITIKNSLFYNPNKYCNAHVILFNTSTDSLVEDTELYDFHRHGIAGFTSRRITARRVYAHERLGSISGGYTPYPGAPCCGGSATLMTFYPCQDCILENSIGENIGGLFEMNANGNGGVPMTGSKVLGSMCIGCGFVANGGYLNSRVSGSIGSPTNILLKDVVLYNLTNGNGVRATSVVNTILDRLTIVGNGGGYGTRLDDTSFGATSTSVTVSNSIVANMTTFGFSSSGYTTWSGSNNMAWNNGTNYIPALTSNWSFPVASVTADPQLGTCIAWAPDGSAAKIAGRGATILYRYTNGILTNVPLWDTLTGAFPFGDIVLGVNDVPGSSLFDLHSRLHINSGGCSFPSGYGAEPTPQTQLTQSRFVFEEFNGPEVSPSRKAGESVNYTVQVGGCARVRVKVTADVNISAGPRGFVVWAAMNGGAYAALTDEFVSKIKFSGLGGDTVVESTTTEQLTDDEPSFSPGPIVRSAAQSIQIDMGPNVDTEVILMVCIQDTAVPGTDYWDFKLRQVNPSTLAVSDLDVYDAIPRLTTKRRAAGAI